MRKMLGPAKAADEIEIITGGPLAVAVLAEIHAQCFEEPWDAAALASLLSLPGALALLASTLGREATPEVKPLGFVLLRAVADEAEILSLAVRPEARRRGHGRRLLRAAVEAARLAGAARLFLEVAEDNRPALALYSSESFAEIGRRREYYHRAGAGLTALVLTKTVMSTPERNGD